jgi:hypothetical protein
MPLRLQLVVGLAEELVSTLKQREWKAWPLSLEVRLQELPWARHGVKGEVFPTIQDPYL